jgi:hypothetical protein
MSDSGKVDDLYKSEDHILPSAKGKEGKASTGSKIQAYYTMISRQAFQTLLIFLKGVW